MRTAALLLTLAFAPGNASAQTPELFASPILVIDQDRIFSETVRGAEALEEFDEAARTLSAENARIEAELIEEERALTEERPTLDPQVFRERADAFDAKVQRIRAEQDQKAREIQLARDTARQTVIREAAEVIRTVGEERGALIVLDRRSVILSAEAIDITAEVIARIDADDDEGDDEGTEAE